MCADSTPPRLSFLGLPVEIRNEIYRNLLLTRRTKNHFGLGLAKYHLQPAILCISHQIHDEAVQIWQKNRLIRITTNWRAFKKNVIVQGKFPLIAAEKKAKSCNKWHMKLYMAFMGQPMSNAPFHDFITCLEDLEHLCRLLFYISCQFLDFTSLVHIDLRLKDPHLDNHDASLPETLQESLIMPFAPLKGLRKLTLAGVVSETAKTKLDVARKKPNPTPADYLESAAGLEDEGNAAFKLGKYRLSIETYIKAYEAMHIIAEGRRFAIMLDCFFSSEPLDGVRFNGKRGDLVRHQLGSQLSWNMIQAYLKLEDFRQAYIWAERAISEIEYANVQQLINDGAPDLVTDGDKAKVYYRMVLACKGLGLDMEIRNNLIKAAQYAPNDRSIMKKLEDVAKMLNCAGQVIISCQTGYERVKESQGDKFGWGCVSGTLASNVRRMDLMQSSRLFRRLLPVPVTPFFAAMECSSAFQNPPHEQCLPLALGFFFAINAFKADLCKQYSLHSKTVGAIKHSTTPSSEKLDVKTESACSMSSRIRFPHLISQFSDILLLNACF